MKKHPSKTYKIKINAHDWITVSESAVSSTATEDQGGLIKKLVDAAKTDLFTELNQKYDVSKE